MELPANRTLKIIYPASIMASVYPTIAMLWIDLSIATLQRTVGIAGMCLTVLALLLSICFSSLFVRGLGNNYVGQTLAIARW